MSSTMMTVNVQQHLSDALIEDRCVEMPERDGEFVQNIPRRNVLCIR